MSREKQIKEMRKEVAKAHRFFLEDEDYEILDDYIADRLYNADYRKQEWISVDERLPEIEGTYLAYTLRRTIEIAHFYPYYVNGKPQFDYWITHWMPLPEAPKMKGGAE